MRKRLRASSSIKERPKLTGIARIASTSLCNVCSQSGKWVPQATKSDAPRCASDRS